MRARNQLLLQGRRRREEPDHRRVEVGLGLGINRRDLPLPGITDSLAKLADVPAVVPEMDGQLLPADRSRPFWVDAWQAISKPSVEIEGCGRIADLTDRGFVKGHGMLSEMIEKPLGHEDLPRERAVLTVDSAIFVRQFDFLDPEFAFALLGRAVPADHPLAGE